MIKSLLKIRLRSAISGMFKSKKADGKISVGRVILFSFLFLYLAAVFVGLAFMMAFALGSILIGQSSEIYFGIFLLAAFSVIFVLSIFETKSELFECKDNELLLAMPIKPRDIVISRIAAVLVYNYIEEAVVMLPAITVYAILSGDAVGVIGALIASLFLAPLATALASAVGYLVALISRRVRRKNLITVAISLGFLFAYFGLYGSLVGNMDAFLENPEASSGAITESLGFLGVFGAAALLSPLNLAVYIAASVGVCALAYCVISKSFFAVATDNRGAKRTKYKEKRLERGSVISALVRNEFSRFFSSATYMLNAGLGVIMQLAVAVIAISQRSSISELIGGLEAEIGAAGISSLLAPMAAVAVAMLSSVTTMSASALSLEGKNFWLIKSMPVSGRSVVIAKTLPHLMLSLPASLVSSILMSVAFSLEVAETVLVVLFACITCVTFAVWGTVMNFAFPKFEFENEAQVVKQSLAVTLVLLSQLAFEIISFILSVAFAFIIGSILTLLLMNFIVLVLGTILSVILFRVSTARYERL